MKQYDLILFDLDGTLIDSGDRHHQMFDRYYERHLPELMGTRLGGHGGRTILTILRNEGVDEDLIERFFDGIDGFYANGVDDIINSIHFIQHTKEVLAELRTGGVQVGLVTNSMQSLVDVLLERNGLQDCFDYVIGSKRDTVDKIAHFHNMVDMTGFDPKRVLYIGDTETDVEVAHEAGIECCILYSPIAWVESKEALLDASEPEFIIRDVRKIPVIAL